MPKIQIEMPDGQQQIFTLEEKDRCYVISDDQGNQKEFSIEEVQFWKGTLSSQGRNLMISSPGFQRSLTWLPTTSKGQGDKAPLGQDLRALFPGKIIKVHAQEKEFLEEGEVAVVMESMKMEYQYKSPKKIWIEKVLVQEGDSVAKGQNFFQIQEEKSA